MKKWKTRRPDYTKLYPDVNIPEDVLQFLKKSDRRMEYLEYDIKRYRYARGKDGKTIRDSNGNPAVLPEREVSLEKLIAEGEDFPSSAFSTEDEIITRMEREELRGRLSQLNSSERKLIGALFYSNGGNGMSEREYARLSGIPRKTIAYQKAKILAKLREDY